MKKIKPINLMDTCPRRPEKPAIIDGVREILMIAKVRETLPLNDYGRWRHEQWRSTDDGLVPFLSVDWYAAHAWDEARGQVNGEMLITLISEEPWRKPGLVGDHYDIMLLDEDLYTSRPDWPDDFIVAISRQGIGTVISTHRLGAAPFTMLKTVIMHELAHVFSTPDAERKDLEQGHGPHCANECIMRYPEKTPEDWERLTWDRFRHGAFCESCIRDLRGYFEHVEEEPVTE